MTEPADHGRTHGRKRWSTARRWLASLARRRVHERGVSTFTPGARSVALAFYASVSRRWRGRGRMPVGALGFDLRRARRLATWPQWAVSVVARLDARHRARRASTLAIAQVPGRPAPVGAHAVIPPSPARTLSRPAARPATMHATRPTIASGSAPRTRPVDVAGDRFRLETIAGRPVKSRLVTSTKPAQRRPDPARRLVGVLDRSSVGPAPPPGMPQGARLSVPQRAGRRAIASASTFRPGSHIDPLARAALPFDRARGGDLLRGAPPPSPKTRTSAFSILSGSPARIMRGTSRREYLPAPVLTQTARLQPLTGGPSETQRETLPHLGPLTRATRASTPAEATWPALEKAVTASVERRLDRKITAAIHDALGADTELTRTMREGVYDTLHDRLVLERERRG